MKIVVTILTIFLIRYAYLDTINTITDIGLVTIEHLIHSCILDHNSISIILFTSEIPGKNIGVQKYCDDIDPNKQIYFIVHGFISSSNESNFRQLASQLTMKYNYIAFILDWSKAACTNGIPIVKYLEYPAAVKNTRDIGERMASFIKLLIDKCGVSIKNISMIGHSLGAHVCGFAAKHLQKWGYGKIRYIIGADPAKPLFMFNNCNNKLCKSDADRLNIIHSSILGMPYAMGNSDLYFNGGKLQPNCGLDVNCSHTRSISYLNIILKNNCGFPGVPMSSGILSLLPSVPVYPDSTTTNCVVVNNTIFENGNMKEGKFNVIVESKYPYCTKKSFNCQ